MTLPTTAAALLASLGVTDAPIARQREAVYGWLGTTVAAMPDTLKRDLVRHGLLGPVVGDEPVFDRVSDPPD